MTPDSDPHDPLPEIPGIGPSPAGRGPRPAAPGRTTRERNLALAVILVLALLGGMGYYMWSFDYREKPAPRNPEASAPAAHLNPEAFAPKAHLTASVRAAEIKERYFPSTMAHYSSLPDVDWAADFDVRNDGPDAVRVLTGMPCAPFLVLRLEHLGEPGLVSLPLIPAHGNEPALPAEFFRPADLPPGQKWTLSVRLTPAYDLSEPGRYRLTATYQPLAYARAHGLDLAALGVAAETLTASCDFEVHAPPRDNEKRNR